MRKLLTALLLLLSTASWGQYNNLIDTNKVWNVVEESWGASTTNTYRFLNKDTTYNSYTYKILSRNLYSTEYWFREDSSGKVFFGEYLIYDFSLKKGDTTTISNIFNSSTKAVVDSTNTITLLNGEKRKRLYLHETDCWKDDIWVEGIGSINGILYSFFCGYDISFYLLCYFENDTLKYKKPYSDTCYYNSVGLKEDKLIRSNTNIYPNPVTGMLHIETTEKIAVDIYNVYGELVQVTTGKEIDFAPYHKGVYFVVIKTATTTFYKRVVKI